MSPAGSVVSLLEAAAKTGPLDAARPATLPPVETTAAKVRRLQAEAKSLARDHVSALVSKMQETADLAAEIALGGEVYAVGVRREAERLAEDLASKSETLKSILNRSK